jgi:hypothetical protein
MVDIKPLRTSRGQKSTKRKSQIPALQSEGGGSPQVLETSVKDVALQTPPDKESRRRHESSRQLPTEKERFEHTFTEFAEAQNAEIDLQPIVSGRRIQLFDLWTIVMKPGFNSYTEDEGISKWDQIASQLGFNKSRDPDAPYELRELYNWILADFAEIRSQYRAFLKDLLNSGGILTEEQALDLEYLTPAGYEEEDQVVKQQLQEEEDNDPEVPTIPSSPPQRIWPSFAKRDRPDAADLATSPQQHEATPYKRQRVDKGKEKVLEIPSTPEDRLKFDRQVRERSPFKDQNLIHKQDEDGMSEEDEEESMFVRPVQRKIFSKTSLQATKAVQFEPETQDFHFSHAAEEENDTPLSQQVQEDDMTAGESVVAIAGSLREDFSTQSQTDSQREAAEVQELVDHYISLGYPEEVVQEAMLATTLETGDVAMVMESIMQGHGIPENIEGVWTAEDDRAVRLIEDNEKYVRVVLKHTEARCVKRRQLLSQTESLKDS